MGRKLIKLEEGDRYGKLTVICLDHIQERPKKKGGVQSYEYYRCKCDCGNEKIVSKAELRQKRTQSCGCMKFNKYLTYKGETKNLVEWSKETGIAYQVLLNRVYMGWDTERTLTKEVREVRKPRKKEKVVKKPKVGKFTWRVV